MGVTVVNKRRLVVCSSEDLCDDLGAMALLEAKQIFTRTFTKHTQKLEGKNKKIETAVVVISSSSPNVVDLASLGSENYLPLETNGCH